MDSTARRLLVSIPTLTDPNFFRSVVFVLEHDAFLRCWLPGKGMDIQRQTTGASWKPRRARVMVVTSPEGR